MMLDLLERLGILPKPTKSKPKPKKKGGKK